MDHGWSVAALERASHNAVPAPRTAFEGPFLVRAFLGGTGRANAASALDPAPLADLATHLDRVEALYARLGLPSRFRLTPLDPPGLEAELDRRGYGEGEESRVMAGPLAGFAAPDHAVSAAEAPDEGWLSVVATADYQTPARRAEKLEAPPLMALPAAWLTLAREGRPAAVGQVALSGELLGFFDIATHPDCRRQGLGRRLLGAGAAWGMARGARHGWLQVSAGNARAIALYEALGFREAYRYRYRLQKK